MMYMVTVVKDIYDVNGGVEIAGIFDTEEKAWKAKARVVEWLKNEECEDYEVFVRRQEVNNLTWYEIDENI